MLNIDSGDEELGNAAYGLLRAVCSYLEFDKNPIVSSQGSHNGSICSLVVSLRSVCQRVSFLVIPVPSL